MQLKVKLDDGAPLPRHAKPGDAGLDLTSRYNATVFPGETAMIHTGVRVAIPEGYCGLVLPRSGVASKRGLAPINSPGLIDSGYRGEVMVPLHNYAPIIIPVDDGMGAWYVERNDEAIQRIERGERIAQLVVVHYVSCECVEVDELSKTERGEGGFGSTGAA